MQWYVYLIISCGYLLWSIGQVQGEVILESDIAGSDTNVTLCPDTTVVFTCQTTSGALVWIYNMGSTTVYQTSDDDIDEGVTESNGGFLFNLTDISGNNLTSTATVNITSDVTVTCSSTGVADDPNNVELTILVLETPDKLKDLQIEEECYDGVTLQWSSLGGVGTIFLDEYILYVSPNPDYGDCENGICWFNNTSAVIDGLQDGVEYEFSVSGVNCAGIGNGDTIMQLITAEVPLAPQDVKVSKLSTIDGMVPIRMEWECPTLTCKQPPIDTYIVTITGVTTRLEMVDASFCNAQFLLEECGVYAFTVKATNREGTSPASNAIPISTGTLSLSTSVTKTNSKSVTITIRVTECIRSAIDNITIYYSQLTADTKVVSLDYPANKTLANYTLDGLTDDTQYNATVVVFYNDGSGLNTLESEMFRFTTVQDFSAFQLYVIIGLVSGFAVGLLIMTVLIIAIFILGAKKYNQKTKKIKKDLAGLHTAYHEAHEDIRDIQLNAYRQTQQTVEHPEIKKESHLYPQLQFNENVNEGWT